MPLIRYLFMRSVELAESDYYGYINSDIIVTPNLFETLDEVQELVKKGKIKPKVHMKFTIYL